MLHPTQQLAIRGRGFTLVELAVVLAVSAVLIAVVVPGFIESKRDEIGAVAIKDMLSIQEAASTFYHSRAPDADPSLAFWPGQALATGPNCPTPTDAQIKTALTAAGLIQDPVFRNPWGGPDYGLRIRRTPAVGPVQSCDLEVFGNVPTSVAPYMAAMLPQGRMGNVLCPGLGPPGANNSWVCSRVSRPGLETSITNFEYAPGTMDDVCTDLGGTVTAGSCQITTSTVRRGCYWAPTCPAGYAGVGSTCAGKYCASLSLYCCQLSNQ